MYQSFKTVVMTLTLLAVGYGAHRVINRPMASNDSPLANSDGWNTPDLTLRDGHALRPNIGLDEASAPSRGLSPPDDLSPRISLPDPTAPLPPIEASPNTGSANAGFAANGSSRVAQPVASRHDRSAGFPGLIPLTANATSPPSANVTPHDPAPVSATAALSMTDNSMGGGTSQAVADYGDASGARQASAPLPATTTTTWDTNVQNVSSLGSEAISGGIEGMEDSFEAIWNSVQSKLASRDYAQALFTLSLCYGDRSLTVEQQDRILPLLDQLAGTVIYSRENHLLKPHAVQSGETVADIASRYNIPPEFLARVNGLGAGIALQPGQTLKVVQGPFRGQLNLTRRELTVFLNRYYAGRFVVSVGRDAPSEEMVLQVGEKSGPRPYHDPATGQQIPPNDPTNPYGSHWIGLQTPGTPATKLAIHSAGAQLDASDTRGCCSVSSKDAADLMAILSIGSRVTVVR